MPLRVCTHDTAPLLRAGLRIYRSHLPLGATTGGGVIVNAGVVTRLNK